MTNHEEKREFTPSVHMIMAFNRAKDSKLKHVIRKVVKHSLEETLTMFRSQLIALGGEWRIHHTVNARDVEKARKHLMHKLIDHPENACAIDTEWRTSLLQRSCIYGEKRWMLDVDTRDADLLKKLALAILQQGGDTILEVIPSPKGYHYIIKPCDTREIMKLRDEDDKPYVILLRDGYYYLETVGGK